MHIYMQMHIVEDHGDVLEHLYDAIGVRMKSTHTNTTPSTHNC